MNPHIILIVIALYFGLLLLIAKFTAGKGDNQAFFTANRQSPWYLVAFGMIGASLSGVTLISIPGEVGNIGFQYFQLVIGYLAGYAVIAFVLMPVYYKRSLISIYTYLGDRFGRPAYKTGAVFFLISQTIGASFRLFLAAMVLQIAVFSHYNIPFELSVAITILLIWLYTYRSGIKTIVWTDTLQTVFMLLAVALTIVILLGKMDLSVPQAVKSLSDSELTTVFNWDWKSPYHFFKQFLSGAFIAIVMTGLDQNMMQKNLTCRSLADAQKNMVTFSLTLLPANLLFLFMGALMYLYIQQMGLNFTDSHGFMLNQATNQYVHTDALYPLLAMNYLGGLAAMVFIVGVIAAAFSSADSAMTALTTSFCIDIMNIKELQDPRQKKTRYQVHIAVSVVVMATIVVFKALNNSSVINAVFTMAGYTYGPLLGLFSFGLFCKRIPKTRLIPVVAIVSPIITFLINSYSEQLLNGYRFGFELLLLNGFLTFLGLWLLPQQSRDWTKVPASF